MPEKRMRTYLAGLTILVVNIGLVVYLGAFFAQSELPSPAATFDVPTLGIGLERPAEVRHITFGPDGRLLLLTCADYYKLHIWDWQAKKVIASYRAPGCGVMSNLSTKRGAGCLLNELVLIEPIQDVWQFLTLEKLDIERPERYEALALSDDGRFLAVGKGASCIEVWDLEKRKLLCTIESLRPTKALLWLEDGVSLLSLHVGAPKGREQDTSYWHTGELRIIDVRDGRIVKKAVLDNIIDTSMAHLHWLGGKDQIVLVGCKYMNRRYSSGERIFLTVFEVKTLSKICDYIESRDIGLMSSAVEPRGKYIAYSGKVRGPDKYDSFLTILDGSNMKPIHVFELRAIPTGLAFSPDGKFFAFSLQGTLQSSVHIYQVKDLVKELSK